MDLTDRFDDYHYAEKIGSQYVCSNCWGNLLVKSAHDRRFFVECRTCGDDTKGFVTRYYAEQRRAESRADLVDAKKTLTDAGIIQNPHKGKTTEELNKELGF